VAFPGPSFSGFSDAEVFALKSFLDAREPLEKKP